MARELKEIISKHLASSLEKVDGFVMIDYRGLNSEQTQDLRSSMRKSGVQMTVVQNRLTRRVLKSKGTPDACQSLLKGPTAIVAIPLFDE